MTLPAPGTGAARPASSRRAGEQRQQVLPVDAIPALLMLLEALGSADVPYCLWKSNVRVALALAGATDLDLLVDRGHNAAFRAVLQRHGLRRLVPVADADYPGIEHYLGLDRPSGRLFHLHVYYQLVLGERYVKSYRIPIEAQLLRSRRVLAGVPVPAAELELAILCVRTLLKYRARDAVKDILGIRSPGIPGETLEEIAWLLGQTSIDEVGTGLEDCPGVVPLAPVRALVDLAGRRPRSGVELLHLRRRMRSALRPLRRHGTVVAKGRYVAALWRRRRMLRGRPWDGRMTLATGGLSAALVGADGAGKSTAARSLADWLSWKVGARTCYMGSKEPSRGSRWLYVAFRALRRGERAIAGRLGSGAVPATAVRSARDVTLALHHLSVGEDRVRRYRAACRDVHAGRVVFFDRFPLESLSSLPEHRLLDGPQIAAALGKRPGRLTSVLARAEERRYRHFRLPDVLILLDVDAELGVRRKPDHEAEILAIKSRSAMELAVLARAGRQAVRVWLIDAGEPLEAVLTEIKSRLWDVL